MVVPRAATTWLVAPTQYEWTINQARLFRWAPARPPPLCAPAAGRRLAAARVGAALALRRLSSLSRLSFGLGSDWVIEIYSGRYRGNTGRPGPAAQPFSAGAPAASVRTQRSAAGWVVTRGWADPEDEALRVAYALTLTAAKSSIGKR